jgi:hypothetical protein
MTKLQIIILVLGIIALIAGVVWWSRRALLSPLSAVQGATVELVMGDRIYVRVRSPVTGVKLELDGAIRCEWDRLEPGEHPLPQDVLNDIAMVQTDLSKSMTVKITALDRGVDTSFMMGVKSVGKNGARAIFASFPDPRPPSELPLPPDR